MSTTTATYMMVSSTTITTLSLQTSWLNCFHELCFKPLNPPLYHTVYTYGVHVMCSLLSKVRRRLIYLIRTRIRYEHLSVICPTLIRIQLELKKNSVRKCKKRSSNMYMWTIAKTKWNRRKPKYSYCTVNYKLKKGFLFTNIAYIFSENPGKFWWECSNMLEHKSNLHNRVGCSSNKAVSYV